MIKMCYSKKRNFFLRNIDKPRMKNEKNLKEKFVLFLKKQKLKNKDHNLQKQSKQTSIDIYYSYIYKNNFIYIISFSSK